MVDTVKSLSDDVIKRAATIGKAATTLSAMPISTAAEIALVQKQAKGVQTETGYIAGVVSKLVTAAYATVPTPTPPPVEPPPVTPPPVEPPPTVPPVTPSSGAPSGPTDPRFANIRPGPKINFETGKLVLVEDRLINDGGADNLPAIGYSNVTARRIVAKVREGIRLAAPGNLTVEDFYIEIYATGDDHGDGCQAYTGAQTDTDGATSVNNVFRRGLINMQRIGSKNNAGIFFADRSRVKALFEDVTVIGGANCPNGAIWMPNRKGDTGVVEIGFKNFHCDYVRNGIMGIDYDGGGLRPKITVWENVTTLQNGKVVQVPRPY